MKIKIKIILVLIFLFSSFCYDDNYELEKTNTLENDLDNKIYALRNITNHNLAKREVYKYQNINFQKLENEELTYPLILVTGSHGKGSTVLKIAGALTIAGAYTKPYTTTKQRFRVNGIIINPEELVKIYNSVENDLPFKNLEIYISDRRLYMLFMAYFTMKTVDVGIIEGHLGGLYDVANYITPLISVITNHLLEHTDKLGNTIRKIGLHKSGIIKDTVPAVLGHEIDIQSLDVYSRHFHSPIAIIYPNRSNYTFDELNAKTARYSIFKHSQIDVFSEVCYILKSSKFPKLTKYSIAAGMKEVRVFGRLQNVPLANQKQFIMLNKYPKAVIIDYPTGVATYKLLIREIKEKYPDSRIRLIFITLKNRDHKSILNYLIENIDYLHLIGCVDFMFECYQKLETIMSKFSTHLKIKWMKLNSKFDTTSYEHFKATIEYAFKLSSYNKNNEVIIIAQVIEYIQKVFKI